MTTDYQDWFKQLTKHEKPRNWQRELGDIALIKSRLIRIPTGLGKTEGVLSAWSYHRIERDDDAWPRRLVWCLPMRVLVEQTKAVANKLVSRIDEARRPSVHVAMGGEDAGDWHMHPQQPAIIVGTQDMLLSRALNRGYAAGRARWPIDYALLNQDVLWVMDEVQLMDVGLVTSVQYQAFCNQDEPRQLMPRRTWWMSATMQPTWFDTVDFSDHLDTLKSEAISIPDSHRKGTVWETTKPLQVETIAAKGKDSESLQKWSRLIQDSHQNAEYDESGRVTLVIVNRVDDAQAIHATLVADLGDNSDGIEVELIHSRFRGLERQQWVERFLSRNKCENKSTNLIIVATQVVEAGVDISASAMVTQLAPWSSLVQRFGRAARYQGTAQVTVVDFEPDEKSAAPYDLADLQAAREALSQLSDVSLNSLEAFQDTLQSPDQADFLGRLYRYEYIHLLTRQEFDELFDTSPDLTGADLDISRFIRSGDERDVYVFWTDFDWEDKRDTDANPPATIQPLRDGLCPVPVYRAKKWLFRKDKCRAWVWDYLDSKWVPLTEGKCYPGQVVLVDVAFGGYDSTRGFTGERPKKKDAPIETTGGVESRAKVDLTDAGQNRDDRSQQDHWKTIGTHGLEVAACIAELTEPLKLDESLLIVLRLAALWHDIGKVHPAFQYNIVLSDGAPPRSDFAKGPNWVDCRAKGFTWPEENRESDVSYGKRRGFRHELASVLALFEILARFNPKHEALLGPYQELIECGLLGSLDESVPLEDQAIAECLDELTAAEFNLLVYLVCCHHGKVRGTWQATPQDQEFRHEDTKLAGRGLPLRGIRDGDPLPAVELALPSGDFVTLPALLLHLDPAAVGLSPRYGASWTNRVHSLLDRYGPTTLAFLESLLRVADWHGSALETTDERINLEVAK